MLCLQGDSPADLAVVCGDPKLADTLKVGDALFET